MTKEFDLNFNDGYNEMMIEFMRRAGFAVEYSSDYSIVVTALNPEDAWLLDSLEKYNML